MQSKPLDSSTTGEPPLKRRGLLLGAGAAGAVAVAARTVPVAPAEVATTASLASLDPAGGYQVTPHVLRYYQTAKV